jgi:hypothetical protein
LPTFSFTTQFWASRTLRAAALTIAIHYEALAGLSRLAPRLNMRARRRMILIVFAIALAHGVEVWLFAGGLYLASEVLELGRLEGTFTGSVRDYVYFSVVSYTSLGYGDIRPTGFVRIIAGFEAVIGLLMMAWSAAFTLHVMQKYWGDQGDR